MDDLEREEEIIRLRRRERVWVKIIETLIAHICRFSPCWMEAITEIAEIHRKGIS